jgi:hypothetical protein
MCFLIIVAAEVINVCNVVVAAIVVVAALYLFNNGY